MYGFAWKRIAIKNQKTRWGSCSKSGNLNFNFKIALLPDRAAEYVVVHELCHLAQMNHSKKFWDLVAQTIPEHRKIRQQLKIISLKI
jgi:predicted metal-dependent hydrolase